MRQTQPQNRQTQYPTLAFVPDVESIAYGPRADVPVAFYESIEYIDTHEVYGHLRHAVPLDTLVKALCTANLRDEP